MPEEILNNGAALEAGAESVENATPNQEVVAPEGGEDNQPAAEPEVSPVHTETKGQNRGKNNYYKGLRTQLDSQSEGIMGLARAKGLNPKDATEALGMLKADAAGQTWPEYQAAQQQNEDLIRSSPIYQEAARKAEAYDRQQEMAADLAAIQQVDPSIKSLDELGEEWNEMVARGMSGVDAFYAMRGKAAMLKAALPPDVGEVGGTGDDENRDFTSEELDRLTDKDMDDHNIFKRALRSMERLGR